MWEMATGLWSDRSQRLPQERSHERFLCPLHMHVPLTGIVELTYPSGFSEMMA